MKVLFAVNNESISESIVKRYQQDYKEIISVKNVYYFNAIIKELQRDKAYDRIVISEDLEPFSNNNYEAIDKFIFEKMDNISDEATNQSGNDIPIILICADRRTKSEPLLTKLFGIGVYNALIGKDRSITTVCELLNRPRGKKEAKAYYNIDSDDVDYKIENEGDVSEVEIQNILNHYKKLGRNEEKYVESFEHIASQYTDSQLRLISKFLPLNVKAVLEANSTTYQSVVSFNGNTANKKQEIKYNDYQKNAKTFKTANKLQNNKNANESAGLDVIEKNLGKNKITEPVIVPSEINTANVRKVGLPTNAQVQLQPTTQQRTSTQPMQNNSEIDRILNATPAEVSGGTQRVTPAEYNNVEEPEQEVLTAQPKRRGRPRKAEPEAEMVQTTEEPKKRGRGRPRKVQNDVDNTENEVPEEVEQPGVNVPEPNNAPVNLFELGDDDNTNQSNQANNNTAYSDMILPGLDDEDEPAVEPQEEFTTDLPHANDMHTNISDLQQNVAQNNIVNSGFRASATQAVQNTGKYNLTNADLSGLLTRDKKMVAFVGTSKNGTSFLVNNLAEMLSQNGIKTAILDLTQNKNAYYIYTQNDESLRRIAYETMSNLRNGNPSGIVVNKNLTVYTTLPGTNEDVNDYANILETLLRNYSLILLDCDFETNYGYFKEAQEIYLVQSLDVLTIQPLTAFLRDLKAKNVLYPERIRIALNKTVKVRSITERTIIGGMAYYNDPAMSFMTELFNKDLVQYCSIPFEEQAYSRYLEGLANCKISLSGYSKNFMAALSKLSNMVYPLVGNGDAHTQKKYNNYGEANNSFSSSMNDTLNKMKNNY